MQWPLLMEWTQMIEYTFPVDFVAPARHPFLAGQKCSNGWVFANGSPHLTSVLGLSVRFPSVDDGLGEFRELVVSVAITHDLFCLAQKDILSGMVMSDSYELAASPDLDGLGPTAFTVCGKNLGSCPLTVAAAAEARCNRFGLVFAVVNRPGWGFIGVSKVEFLALGLPVVSCYDL